MATSEEKRFALGLGAALLVLGLGVVAVQFIQGNTPDDQSAERVRPVVNAVDHTAAAVAPMAERAGSSKRADLQRLTDRAPRVDASSLSRTAGPALAAPDEGSDVDPAEATAQPAPVIDRVPLAYFAEDASPLALPTVIEKYIDRVDRGTRFMARLEAIVAESTPPDGENTPLALQFVERSSTKRLSFNARHTSAWIEAAFAGDEAPTMTDVLVDLRRGGVGGSTEDRVALYFASVQEHEGVRSFAIESDVVDGPMTVTVFGVSDTLPRLGQAQLDPDRVGN